MIARSLFSMGDLHAKTDSFLPPSVIQAKQLTHSLLTMERVRWSEKAIPFRSLVDNPAIQKPALGRDEGVLPSALLFF